VSSRAQSRDLFAWLTWPRKADGVASLTRKDPFDSLRSLRVTRGGTSWERRTIRSGDVGVCLTSFRAGRRKIPSPKGAIQSPAPTGRHERDTTIIPPFQGGWVVGGLRHPGLHPGLVCFAPLGLGTGRAGVRPSSVGRSALNVECSSHP